MFSAEDSKGFAQADLDFHLQIARMTRNSIILRIHEILGTILMGAMHDTIRRMGFMGLWYHQAILEAIEQRDGDRAAALMQEHLSNNRRFFSTEENEHTTNA